MFQVPWVITMSIAATRMYRSLSDFLSSDMYAIHFRLCSCSLLIVLALCHDSSQKFLPTSGRTSGAPAAPISLTGIQVVVHKAQAQPSAPQVNHFGMDVTGQPHVKLHEVIVEVAGDDDMGYDSEKRVAV